MARVGEAHYGQRRAGHSELLPPARVGEAHYGLRGADRPDAVAAGQARSDVIDDSQQLYPVVLELAPGLPEGERQTADLGLADGLLATGLSGQVTAGERG